MNVTKCIIWMFSFILINILKLWKNLQIIFSKIDLFLKNNYSKIIIIIFLSLIIDNLLILQINNPPAWDQGYHLSNVFKMYNILGDQGINISEKSSQLLNVTDSYRGPLTYFLSALFLKVFKNTYQFAYLSNQIFNAGEKVEEKVWRMPLHKNYDKLMNSKNADMQNINYVGGAGSTTAAQFLQRFILNKTPWAHLDIAGMAFSKYGGALNSGGATGYGVRLLNKFVEENYE